MDDLIEFYDSYGESLARRLTCIGHSTARKAFVKVADAGNPLEVQKALPSLPGSQNVLVWEQFTDNLDDSGKDNYRATLTGSVSVIRKAGQDVPSQRLAVNEARRALLKVIGLMLQDAYSGPLDLQGISFKVSRQSGQEIGPLSDGWWGWGFEFTWTTPLDLTLSDDDLIVLPD